MRTLIYFILYSTFSDSEADNLRNQSNTNEISPWYNISSNNLSPWYNFIPIWFLIAIFCCTVGGRCCNSIN